MGAVVSIRPPEHREQLRGGIAGDIHAPVPEREVLVVEQVILRDGTAPLFVVHGHDDAVVADPTHQRGRAVAYSLAEIVAYPPGQVGIPFHFALSELSGWAPWLPAVLETAGLKLASVTLAIAIAWAAMPRGVIDRASERWTEAGRRLRGGAGALAVVAAAGMATSAWAQSLGAAEALGIATRVADRVRAGLSVRAALVEQAGERAAALLLDTPHSSDVAVALKGSGVAVQGARLHWKDGGWQPASRSPEVVQRFAHDAAPWRMLQAPANLDAAAAFRRVRHGAVV